MGPCGSFCVLMGPYGSLMVVMCRDGSLWFLMRSHVSLQVFIGPYYPSLWVLMFLNGYL